MLFIIIIIIWNGEYINKKKNTKDANTKETSKNKDPKIPAPQYTLITPKTGKGKNVKQPLNV